MALHWTISFRSLRAGDDYQVNIYDSSYSGNPIPLRGGAQPFTTDESDDEDMFIPVRTQSGYIRIVDNGTDANGNAFNWKTFVPTTDKDRPVTLVKVVGQTRTVVWQGFMQAQNFSGELYNPTQEREFPIQCCLSVLSITDVPTAEEQPQNFAFLLKTCIAAIPQHTISSIVIQGGADAQSWLLKKFDWRTLLSLDEDDEYTASYNLLEALEDMCRFWGWTARTHEQTLYLTSADDTTETNFLTLTPAQLNTMAGGTAAGTTSATFTPTTISGDVFASAENEDMRMRGYNKAVVKGSIKTNDSVIQFAPEKVRQLMESQGYPTSGGYVWYNGPDDDPGVGYYTTARLASFDTSLLAGSCGSYAGFYRRQIYPDVETDKPSLVDEIACWNGRDGNVRASLQTKKMMMFTGGSLKVEGNIWLGAHKDDNWPTTLEMRIGIGTSHANAKWWTLYYDTPGMIYHRWAAIDTRYPYMWAVVGGSIRGSEGVLNADTQWVYESIPCDDNSLYGYLYIDIIGCRDVNGWYNSFELGNLKVAFSRDGVYIPQTMHEYRQRDLVVPRVSSKEYTATNNSTVVTPMNIDCIYASDNNMEYGYGLVIDNNGYMEKANYGNTQAHPEQHLADRVAAYWGASKRKIVANFRKNTIAAITPTYKVTLDGTTLYPVSISHDWRDDIVKLTLMQL